MDYYVQAKTNTRVAIPLLPVAKEILDRYKDHPMCLNQNKVLPVSSNQKMNKYLVEIAALAVVAKILGDRIAKRTFATTVTLMNGVPIESVSKMLAIPTSALPSFMPKYWTKKWVMICRH